MKALQFSMLLIGVIVGCGTVESDSIKSSGLYALMRINSDGQRTDVWVNLSVGSPTGTLLDLSENDTFTATARGVERAFAKIPNILGDFSYETYFPFAEDNMEIRLSLLRENEVDAPNSVVRLPEGFTVTSPVEDTVFAQDGDITVTWEPFGFDKDMFVFFDIDCEVPEGQIGRGKTFVTEDTGSATYQMKDVLFDFVPRGDCLSSVRVDRSQEGTVDPNFGHGGTIEATQYRTVPIIIEQ